MGGSNSKAFEISLAEANSSRSIILFTYPAQNQQTVNVSGPLPLSCTVTGDGNLINVDGDGHSVTVLGDNNVITVTGDGVSVRVEGTGNGLSATRQGTILFTESEVTVTSSVVDGTALEVRREKLDGQDCPGALRLEEEEVVENGMRVLSIIWTSKQGSEGDNDEDGDEKDEDGRLGREEDAGGESERGSDEEGAEEDDTDAKDETVESESTAGESPGQVNQSGVKREADCAGELAEKKIKL